MLLVKSGWNDVGDHGSYDVIILVMEVVSPFVLMEDPYLQGNNGAKWEGSLTPLTCG